MKKFYKLAAFYTVLGLIGGVFFREFTKFNNFTQRTSLGLIHTHALMLGMIFFLVVLLLEKQFQLTQSKYQKRFLILYNSGLLLTIIMLVVRGVFEVLATPLSSGATAAISGIAGVGHILLGIGIFFFFKTLSERIVD